MKSFSPISLLFVFLLMFGFSNAVAQTPFSVGVKGGLNLANASFSGVPGSVKISSLSTFGFGGVVEYETSDFISLQAEPRYVQKGGKISATDPMFGTISSTGKFNYVEVPILLKAKVNAGLITPYVFAGPAIGFLLSANTESEFLGKKISLDIKDETESTEFSLDFGAGIAYGIAPLISLTGDVRYSLGLTNIAKPQNPNDKSNWKSRDVKIFVGLLFSL